MKFYNDFDISDSVFVNEPYKKIESILADYEFKDVSSRHLKSLRYCFIDSKILEEKLITNDLYIVFPKIKYTELIYRMSKDSCSP